MQAYAGKICIIVDFALKIGTYFLSNKLFLHVLLAKIRVYTQVIR